VMSRDADIASPRQPDLDDIYRVRVLLLRSLCPRSRLLPDLPEWFVSDEHLFQSSRNYPSQDDYKSSLAATDELVKPPVLNTRMA
jgi:hypothetical protein